MIGKPKEQKIKQGQVKNKVQASDKTFAAGLNCLAKTTT